MNAYDEALRQVEAAWLEPHPAEVQPENVTRRMHFVAGFQIPEEHRDLVKLLLRVVVTLLKTSQAPAHLVMLLVELLTALYDQLELARRQPESTKEGA